MAFIFSDLAALAHRCNTGGYGCIAPHPIFVNPITGSGRPPDDHGCVPKRMHRELPIQQSIGRVVMLSPNKQLAAEVMTVIILGSATFLAMSSERPVDSARQSGAIAMPVLNSAELPQELVRDYTYGN
jgi:hypothetical protein